MSLSDVLLLPDAFDPHWTHMFAWETGFLLSSVKMFECWFLNVQRQKWIEHAFDVGENYQVWIGTCQVLNVIWDQSAEILDDLSDAKTNLKHDFDKEFQRHRANDDLNNYEGTVL